MTKLTQRESELVALGAALGSNCVPCIEYLVPQARKTGLTDQEIHAAILHADKIRQVPARKVLETALNLLPQAVGGSSGTEQSGDCGCGSNSTSDARGAEVPDTDQTLDTMTAVMSKMMASCAPLASSGGERCDSVKETKSTTDFDGCDSC